MGPDKEVVTEILGAMDSPARGQAMSEQAGLWAGGTSTSGKGNRTVKGKSGEAKLKGRQEDLLKKEEWLLAPVRTRRKRPEQHPVE